MGWSWGPVWWDLHGGNVLLTLIFLMGVPKHARLIACMLAGVCEQVTPTNWPSWWPQGWRGPVGERSPRGEFVVKPLACISSPRGAALLFVSHVMCWPHNFCVLVGCDLWEQHLEDGFLHPKREVHAADWCSAAWILCGHDANETRCPKPAEFNWKLHWKCKLH